jgi:hypothetical protein
MEKLVRDGDVAVLVSHGFGAGWYSWNTECEDLVFDKKLVESVLAKNWDIVESRARELCPGGYFGGIDGLTVEWVAEGEQFEITEYDGAESLNLIGNQSYLTA